MSSMKNEPTPKAIQAPLPSDLYDENYFLTACEGHEEFVRSEGEHLSRRLREAFAFAAVTPGMCVLDLGCGRGEIVRHVAQLGAKSYGLDYSEAAVRLSRGILRNERGEHGVVEGGAGFDIGTLDADVVEHGPILPPTVLFEF